jgi:23S rRNA pseudouridine1911/1915/1917 synthase
MSSPRASSRTWRAPRDGALSEILAELAVEDAAAVVDGRVFVSGVRTRNPAARVAAGSEISITAGQADEAPLVTLFESADVFVAGKPAGLSTIPDHRGDAASLQGQIARHLGLPLERVHATSRLDREVSGVVTFALTPRAREGLARARAEGRYLRRYLALAVGTKAEPLHVWEVPIGRGRDPLRRVAFGRDPEKASTVARIVASVGGATPVSLLAVSPETGRTHQIRLHASHAGLPLLGDRAYGGSVRWTLGGGKVLGIGRIALHAARVTVPVDFDRPDAPPRELSAPVPEALRDLWSALGGEGEAWDTALQCDVSRSSSPS